jgi:HKD family nuclease
LPQAARMRLSSICLAGLLFAACSTAEAADDDGADAPPTDDLGAVDTDLSEPVADAAVAPHLEAFFNVPKADGTPDATLENKIIELIDGTPKGARIRISMYQWNRTKVATHLADAYDKGVDVQLVLDKQANEVKPAARPAPSHDADADVAGINDDVANEDEDAGTTPVSDPDEPVVAAKKTTMNAAVTILQQRLPASAITFCTRGDGSCQGTHIDHNKIYMFSTTGGAHKVVVQSSANLTTHLLHNNLVISRNDNELYTAYVHYFEHLQAKKLNLDFYRSEPGEHTIAYYFPRAHGDTIVSILDNVHCTSNSHIRIAMAFFTADRHAIADRLVALQHDGCDVKVNMRHAGTDVSASIIKTLRNGHVDVATYPDQHGANIHSKYLIVDSAYATGGKYPHRQLVWTGSHNYTGGALRENDEALLRVDNKSVFDGFTHNWNVMRAQM